MNEFDIFKQLTELDDDLLEEKPGKHPSLFRGALIAAVLVSVLALTAVAVAVSVSVSYKEKTDGPEGYGVHLPGYAFPASKDYHTAELQYFLAPVSVQNEALLTEGLTCAWEAWPYAHEFFTEAALTDESGKRRLFADLQEVAELFDLPLTLSEELNRVCGPCTVTLVAPDSAKAALEFADTGKIRPAGIIVCGALRTGVPTLESSITIYIPMTEDFCATYQKQTIISYESSGKFLDNTCHTTGDIPMLLLHTEEASRIGAAAWCCDGIGYLAEIRLDDDTDVPALDVLMPLLRELTERRTK